MGVELQMVPEKLKQEGWHHRHRHHLEKQSSS